MFQLEMLIHFCFSSDFLVNGGLKNKLADIEQNEKTVEMN